MVNKYYLINNFRRFRMNISSTVNSFFAAANTFDGFKSNFDKIFSPNELEHLYILKGGPGTGKSTLMKKLAEAFENDDCVICKIYCSSDPHSLDGIIVEKGKKKIAVIDGTAPHTTDPIFPGAVDDIINLGDGFRTEVLKAEREKITGLNSVKKEHYKNAYACLKACGELHAYIWELFSNSDAYSEAECTAKKIIGCQEFYEKDNNIVGDIFLSAFGKDGYFRLDIPCIKKDYISICGDGISEYIVMNIILQNLIGDYSASLVSSSPLSKKMTDVIITSDSIISTDKSGNILYDTTPALGSLPAEYEQLRGAYLGLLNCASKEFAKAADVHFDLEKIYSSAMDFTNNDKVFKRLREEFAKQLA